MARIDISWSVAVGLTMIDTIRGADFQTRNLLLSLRAGEPLRLARALAMEHGFSSLGGSRSRARTEAVRPAAARLAQPLPGPPASAALHPPPGRDPHLHRR